MKKKPLGRTGILVSELCLGTMTFGTQTNEIDAHKQLDLALESGTVSYTHLTLTTILHV